MHLSGGWTTQGPSERGCLSMLLQCSGYHVSFTRRRSWVQTPPIVQFLFSPQQQQQTRSLIFCKFKFLTTNHYPMNLNYKMSSSSNQIQIPIHTQTQKAFEQATFGQATPSEALTGTLTQEQLHPRTAQASSRSSIAQAQQILHQRPSSTSTAALFNQNLELKDNTSMQSSQVDPQQFQNLFEQMQNNHDFLEKMQGILAMVPLNTESSSDENLNSSQLLKSLQGFGTNTARNRQSLNLNEDMLRSQTSNASCFGRQSSTEDIYVNAMQNPQFEMMQLQRMESQQPIYTRESMDYTQTPSTGSLKFRQITPISAVNDGQLISSQPTLFTQNSQQKNLYQEQFSYEQDFRQANQIQDQFHTPIQSHGQRNNHVENGVPQQLQLSPTQLSMQLQNQMAGNLDPSSISPEYFQLFNQFYQMFQQVQAQTQVDLSNDPQFLQNMMVQYFTFMTQSGAIDGPMLSPQRPSYQNLPLAAIPETKDSMLEENSGWHTVQTTKLALSAITSNQYPQQCNCCKNCQEMKRQGAYSHPFQQCSNFNLGSMHGGYQNSQNQDTFIQKSDISGNSQILQQQLGGYGSHSPSPMIKQHISYIPTMAQHQYASNPQYQSQGQQLANYSLEPCFNQQSLYQSRKDSLQTQMGEQMYPQNLQGAYNQLQESRIIPQHLSPQQKAGNNPTLNEKAEVVLSPQQLHENKLIEYMIENNDFSNYKQRREVIKGKRMSRTLSRSNSKNSTMLRLHKHKLSIQSTHLNINNNNTQRFSSNFGLNNYYSNEESQPMQFLSDQKQIDNYASNKFAFPSDQKALMFFSPQINNKQLLNQVFNQKIAFQEGALATNDTPYQNWEGYQNIQSGSAELQQYDKLESYHSHRDKQVYSGDFGAKHIIASPLSERRERDSTAALEIHNQRRVTAETTGPNKQRQRTLEKIQEIRKLNEQQRSKERLLKKSTTRKNIHKGQQQQQQTKQVFEIKDLKSNSRKNQHLRKQSQNIQSNKENNKLIQSNIYNQYEMSQQLIALSPQQDPLLASMELEIRKKDSNTFKSLNSVANSGYQSQTRQHHSLSNQENIQENLSSPPLNSFKLVLDSQIINQFHLAAISPFGGDILSSLQGIHQHSGSITSAQYDIDQLVAQQEELKKPGTEVHIIKKPVQTEEFKRIQERLNKYYQDKRKDQSAGLVNYQEYVNSNVPQSQAINEMNLKQMHERGLMNSQHAQTQGQIMNSQNDMSMTKTLSSFKSLMMKTMSQMSLQQDNNIQNQFQNGKEHRTKAQSKLTQNLAGQYQSVNVSSIQDDYSVGVDYSENLTKIMSPKNLYNGQLANIKQRNLPHQTADSVQLQERLLKSSEASNQKQSIKKQILQQQCLPNSLFFKEKKQAGPHFKKPSNEDTLSLKYNSRPHSMCYCGQTSCVCNQDSKKDLLSHFQNFLHEMDKHPHFNQNGFNLNRESLYHSPIENIRQSNSTNDFLLSNFQLMNLGYAGRSSSQNSRTSKSRGGLHGNRQSSASASTSNLLGQPKMKRFSSGATLSNLPFKKITNQNLNHCQSTQIFPHLKKISLDSGAEGSGVENQTAEIVIKQIKQANLDSSQGLSSSSHSKLTSITQDQLERLDTNKEEELRLLNIENDIMQKAFILKSHRLNLQDSQRNELLQRIQIYKNQQLSSKPSREIAREGGYSTLHEDAQAFHLNAGNGSTQNTSHITAHGYQSNSINQSGSHSNVNSQNLGKSNFSSNQFQNSAISTQKQVIAPQQQQVVHGHNLMISLEERRKMEKYKKKLELINQIQIDREEEIQKFKDCL